MSYHLTIYGSRGEVRNEAGVSLYYGSVPLCRKAIAEWCQHPLSTEQVQELAEAQVSRIRATWARLLGRP